MYEKCIPCDKLGKSCVPNLLRLPFADLQQWCIKRQKFLGWTNQTLADSSGVPLGTVGRFKSDDYIDCKYSTIRNIVMALVGGIHDEFPCNKKIEEELAQLEKFEKQAARLTAVEKENEALLGLNAEYKEEVCFLRDEVRAWRTMAKNVKE